MQQRGVLVSSKAWLLTDPEEFTPGWSRVHVTKLGSEDSCREDENKILRPIVDEKIFKFSLLYSDVSKMVGYRFDYRNREKHPRKVLFSRYQTFNSVMWFFTSKKAEPKFEVLYEDQVLRLLMYEHEQDKFDYWLVGRWREDARRLQNAH